MDPVDHLLEQILARPEAEWERALVESDAAHPALAGELRRRFEVLRESGLVTSANAAGNGPALPQRLGEFTPVRVLGEGGMGIVYEARQDRLDRRIALKVLRPANVLFDGAAARFRREIEVVARLSHPGIVAVYGVGDDGGVPFFAMELLSGAGLDVVLRTLSARAPATLTGADLAAIVAQRAGEPPTAPDALFDGPWSHVSIEIGVRVAHALEHAHAHGIVHRDVKPSNVIITADGRVVLVDFGLALVSDVDRLTRTGAEVGSLPYLAPETLRGAPPDHRSDQYALALLLYELLALRHPFLADNREATRARVRAGDAPSVRQYNRAAPRDLATVLAKAMDLDPARRYSKVAAFAADLDRVRRRLPITAQPPGSWLRLSRWCQRHPALATGLTLGFLLAAGTPTAIALGIASQRDLALAAEREAQLRAYEGNIAAANAALQAHYVEEARRRLEACPDALRGFEWRHLAMALDGSIATLRGCTAAVTAVALTADAQIVAAADAQGEVVCWQPEVDPAPRRLGKVDPDIEQLAFMAGGRELLAVTKRGRVLRLDAATGAQLAERVPEGQLEWLRLEADGRLFVATGDWRVVQLDPRTLVPATMFQLERSGSPPQREFAVLGDHLLALDVGGVRLWRLSDGRAVDRLACRDASRFVAAGDGFAVVGPSDRVFVGTAEPPSLQLLSDSDAMIRTIAREPRGELLFGLCTDRTLRAWRLHDGARIAVLSGAPLSGPLAVAGSRLLLATGAPDGSVQLWSPFGGDDRQDLVGNDGVVSQLAVAGSGELVSGAHSAAILSWDPGTGEPRRLSAGSKHWINGLAMAADGAHFYASWHGTVARFSTALESPQNEWPLDSHWIHELAAATERGMLLAATEDSGAFLLDAADGIVRRVLGHGGPVLCCAFAPRGTTAFTGGKDGRVVRWALPDAAAGVELARAGGPVRAMLASDEHLFVAAGSALRALDMADGGVRWERPCASPAFCLAALQEPPRLVSGHHDGLLVFWEPSTGRALLTLRLGTGAIRSLAADAAGQWIAAAGDAELIYVLRAASPSPAIAAALRRADARRALRETFALHSELAARNDVVAAIDARNDLDPAWRQRMRGYEDLWRAPSWGRLVGALETAAVPGLERARYERELRVAKAALDWNDAIAPTVAALAHLRLGAYGAAIEAADAGLQRDGPSAPSMAPYLRAARALALIGLGRRQEAAEECDALRRAIAAVERSPQHVSVLAEVEAALAR